MLLYSMSNSCAGPTRLKRELAIIFFLEEFGSSHRAPPMLPGNFFPLLFRPTIVFTSVLLYIGLR